VLYTNKLHLLLQQYINARNIGNSFEKLVSCLVSDRLRSSITDNDCLRYICSLESASKDGWLEHNNSLATSIDAYYANHSEKGFPLNAAGMTGPIHRTSRHAGNNNFRSGNGSGSARSMSSAD
jgi:hypothetical protein